jgi:hypothetical protein
VERHRIETAHQLASELGVRLHDLFDLEDEPGTAERERRRAIQSVTELLRDLNPDTITRLKELIEVGLKLAHSKEHTG